MTTSSKRKWQATYRTSGGKLVTIIVESISYGNAAFQFRKELAVRFRGKTYQQVARPKQID